jgi:hypothetical protein
MKVEVEFYEIEALKEEVYNLTARNKELQEQLNNIDEDELKKRAVRLAHKLFSDYMYATFIALGFKDTYHDPINMPDSLEHYVGKDWFRHPEHINIILGANITNEFSRAFLTLGIITSKKEKTKYEHEL